MFLSTDYKCSLSRLLLCLHDMTSYFSPSIFFNDLIKDNFGLSQYGRSSLDPWYCLHSSHLPCLSHFTFGHVQSGLIIKANYEAA